MWGGGGSGFVFAIFDVGIYDRDDDIHYNDISHARETTTFCGFVIFTRRRDGFARRFRYIIFIFVLGQSMMDQT